MPHRKAIYNSCKQHQPEICSGSRRPIEAKSKNIVGVEMPAAVLRQYVSLERIASRGRTMDGGGIRHHICQGDLGQPRGNKPEARGSEEKQSIYFVVREVNKTFVDENSRRENKVAGIIAPASPPGKDGRDHYEKGYGKHRQVVLRQIPERIFV